MDLKGRVVFLWKVNDGLRSRHTKHIRRGGHVLNRGGGRTGEDTANHLLTRKRNAWHQKTERKNENKDET